MMRFASIASLVLATVHATTVANTGEETPRQIALQPFDGITGAQIDAVKKGAESRFRIRITVLPVNPLPETAYYPPRDRYRAEKLLTWLESKLPSDTAYEKIIGLTHRDISTTKGDIDDWGVFGLGSLGGKTCVISTWRLKPKSDQPASLLVERLIKVVNHEIGHTFGLEHCPTARCLMQDAHGSILTIDREDGNVCPGCSDRLGSIWRKTKSPVAAP